MVLNAALISVHPFSPESLPFGGRCLKEADGRHHQGVRQIAERTPGAAGDVASEILQNSYNLSCHLKP